MAVSRDRGVLLVGVLIKKPYSLGLLSGPLIVGDLHLHGVFLSSLGVGSEGKQEPDWY